MEDQYHIAFADIPWTQSPQRVRSKVWRLSGRQLRLVEFGRDLEHPGWCTTGHIGFVLEGEMEVELPDRTILLRAGDGMNFPPGGAHRHRPSARSEIVRLIFVEEC